MKDATYPPGAACAGQVEEITGLPGTTGWLGNIMVNKCKVDYGRESQNDLCLLIKKIYFLSIELFKIFFFNTL